jgi:hypothetical protein
LSTLPALLAAHLEPKLSVAPHTRGSSSIMSFGRAALRCATLSPLPEKPGYSKHLTRTSIVCHRTGAGSNRLIISPSAANHSARGLIEHHRGVIRILDRRGLEQAACSDYRRSSINSSDCSVRRPA